MKYLSGAQMLANLYSSNKNKKNKNNNNKKQAHTFLEGEEIQYLCCYFSYGINLYSFKQNYSS